MLIETTSEWNLMRRRGALLREMHELVAGNLMRGTLVTLARRCGKARCACTTQGRKHKSRCVSVNLSGRTRLAYVRAEKEAQVRKALGHYRRFWKVLDELTEVNLRLLKLGHGPSIKGPSEGEQGSGVKPARRGAKPAQQSRATQ
jgi:hypothetical protein